MSEEKNDTQQKITSRRIPAGNKWYYGLGTFLSSRSSSRETKNQ